MTSKDLDRPLSSSTDIQDDALAEALEQLIVINADEDDRRKTADSKISTAQNALGFTVTLAGGSAAFAFLQSPVYDLWHILAILALVVAVAFFLIAAWKVADANEPRSYQMRSAPGVRRMLNRKCDKRDLQVEAANDLVSNVNANIHVTNDRLTLYKVSVNCVRAAMVAVGAVPLIIFFAYFLNMAWGSQLPQALRIAPATRSSASPSPTPGPG